MPCNTDAERPPAERSIAKPQRYVGDHDRVGYGLLALDQMQRDVLRDWKVRNDQGRVRQLRDQVPVRRRCFFECECLDARLLGCRPRRLGEGRPRDRDHPCRRAGWRICPVGCRSRFDPPWLVVAAIQRERHVLAADGRMNADIDLPQLSGQTVGEHFRFDDTGPGCQHIILDLLRTSSSPAPTPATRYGSMT